MKDVIKTTRIVEVGQHTTIMVKRYEIILTLSNILFFEPYGIDARDDIAEIFDKAGRKVEHIDCTRVTMVNGSKVIIDEKFDEILTKY